MSVKANRWSGVAKPKDIYKIRIVFSLYISKINIRRTIILVPITELHSGAFSCKTKTFKFILWRSERKT